MTNIIDSLSTSSSQFVQRQLVLNMQLFGMWQEETESEFNARIQQQLKAARKQSGLTQRVVARHLQMETDSYAKYENRPISVLPLYALPRVCELFKIDCWHFLTGCYTQEHLKTVHTVIHTPKGPVVKLRKRR